MRNSEDPADALAALGNEVRISILRTLADAEGSLTFTELREAADVRDTSRFNYHLRELCGRFVRETEDGYALGHAGDRVIAAADVADGEPIQNDPDGECPVCGEADCEKLYHVHLDKPW